MAGRPREDWSDADWRNGRSKESVDDHRKRALASQRAKTKLAQAHQDEFEALYQEERRTLGLPPIRKEQQRR